MAKFKARARALDLLGRQQIAGIPTAINELFKSGKTFVVYPYKVVYLQTSSNKSSTKILITIPKRNFKKADN